MKKLIIITVILITGFFTTAKSEIKIINHSGFEFGFFYSNLVPYGTWIELDAGLIAWRPTIIHTGWSPYRHGRWFWTVDGWYWDSYEPFGYIVFHYGRWYYDEYNGWIWIPDYDWAPAWVEWSYDNDYIGWAPLPPYAVFSVHIGIHYTYNYYVPYQHWHYVTFNHFCDPYVYNYYVAPKYKYRIYSRTKVRHNYGYRNGHVVNNGVGIDIIRKRTGQNIKQRNVVGVSDYKEIEKYSGKNDDVVRTFIASRDELTKSRISDVKDVKIERENKRTTLDVSKVRLGREDLKEKNLDVIKNKELSAGRNNETKKNGNVKTEPKKTYDIVPEKKVERKDIQKKDTNIQRNNDVSPKIENTNKSQTGYEQQKKDVQRKEINNQRDNNVNRKIEIKKESTNNNSPKFEQPKKENKTQVKTEQKRNDIQTRTTTQDKKVERKSNSNNTKKRSR